MSPEFLTKEEYMLLRMLVTAGPQRATDFSDTAVMRLFTEELAVLNKATNRMEVTDKGRSVGRMLRAG